MFRYLARFLLCYFIMFTSILDAAVIGEYKFDDSTYNGTAHEVVDSSGNSYSGLSINNGYGFATPNSIGKICKSVKFTDFYQALRISDNPALEPANITIAFWVKLSDISTTQTLVHKANGTNSNGYSVELEPYFGASITFHIGNESLHEIDTSAVITAGAWHHIAATYDGNTMKIYIDGTENVSDSGHNGVSLGSGEVLTLGNYVSESHGIRNAGYLDELKIYNTALSATDISTLYANEVGGSGCVTDLAINISSSFTNGISGVTQLDFTAMVTDENLATVTYLWDFGDGTTSTDKNPQNHIFSTSGIYNVTSIATDEDGNTITSNTVTITTIQNAPTDIILSSTNVADGSGIGTVVGSMSATDIDTGDSMTFTFIGGYGDTDNGSFMIDGTSLKINFLSDYAAQSSYSVRLRVIDAGGNVYDEAFTINIASVPVGPSVVPPIAEWRFDNITSFDTSASEVTDSIGAYHGRAERYNFSSSPYPLSTDYTNDICRSVEFEDTYRHFLETDGDYDDLDNTSFTITFMAYLNYDRDGWLISKWETWSGYGVKYESSTNRLEFYTERDSSYDLVSTTNSFNPGSWHHVAVSYDGSTRRIYIDGSLNAFDVTNSNNNDIASSGKLTIGGRDTSTYQTDVIMDEVKYFDSALNDHNISIIATNELAGNNYDGTTRICPYVGATPMTQLLMDECSWDGTHDEVKDWISSNHGTTAGVDLEDTDNDICHSGNFGSSDKITIDHNASMESVQFTISTRFFVDSLPQASNPIFTKSTSQQQVIAQYCNGFPIPFFGFCFGTRSYDYASYYDGYGLFIENNGNMYFYVGHSLANLTPPINISTGQWYDITVSYDGTTLRIYVNDVFSAFYHQAGLSASTAADLLIGSDPSNRYFDGQIDEWSYYDTALSDADVGSQYTKRITAKLYDGSARICPTCPAPPSIDINTSVLSGVGGVSLFDFVANVSDENLATLTYMWDFDDTSNSTDKDPKDHMFTSAGSYSVSCVVTDEDANAVTSNTLIITITQNSPTDIALTGTSVVEGSDFGTIVGTISSVDVDMGDSATYTLVAGTGSTDNASFLIDGTSLKINVVSNYEVKNSYSIRLRVTDAIGNTYEEAFVITISNSNERPTDIVLSSTAINENNSIGAVVGTLSATDQDVGDTAVYTLIAGAGDNDNGSFTITGTSLKLTPVADYEVKSSYSVRVRISDGGGLTYEELFAITINDINEAPVGAIKTITINEDESYTFTTIDFGFSDEDIGDTLSSVKITTLESAGALKLSGSDVLLNDVISTANISANNLVFTPVTSENGSPYATFSFSVSDGSLDSVSSYVMTINVNAVNNAPTITISSDRNDANASETEVNFSLVSADGDGDINNATYLWDFNDSVMTTDKNPSAHIFERSGEYNVTCVVTDENGSSTTSNTLVISVGVEANEDKILLNEIYVSGSTLFVEAYTVDEYSSINRSYMNSVQIKVCKDNNTTCSTKTVVSDCNVTNDHYVVCEFSAGKMAITNSDVSDVSLFYQPNSKQYFLDYLEINGQLQVNAAADTYTYDITSPATTASTVDIEREPDGIGNWQLGASFNTKAANNVFNFNITTEHYMDDCVYGNGDVALDSSGNSYSATVVNSISMASELICSGFDMTSSNQNDFLKLDNNGLNGLRNFAIIFGFKPVSLANGTAFISAEKVDGNNDELLFDISGGAFRFTYRGSSVNFGMALPALGGWSHIILSKNEQDVCLILNGVEECQTGSSDFNVPLSIHSDAFSAGQDMQGVGSSKINSSGDFNGVMDELIFFSTPLNESVAQYMYNNYAQGGNRDYLGNIRACGSCINPMAYQDKLMINEVHASSGEKPFIEIFASENFSDMNVSDIDIAKVEWCENGGSCVAKDLNSSDCNLSSDERFLVCPFNTNAFSLSNTKDTDISLYMIPNVNKVYFNYLKINGGSRQSDANQSTDGNDFKVITQVGSVGVDRVPDGSGDWSISYETKGATNAVTIINPISEYRMDYVKVWDGVTIGEVNDTIGGRHGLAGGDTVTNDFPIADIAGGLCQSGDFSIDKKARLIVPDSSALEPNEITIALRTKLTSLTYTDNYLIHKTSNRGTNADGYALMYYVTDKNFEFFVGGDDADNTVITPTNSFTLDGTWHSVVTTYNGMTLKIYIDGQLSASKDKAGLSTASSGDFLIGGEEFNNYFGHIDEVKIFNKALNAKQIQAIHINEAGGLDYKGVTRVCGTATASGSTHDFDAIDSSSIAKTIGVKKVGQSFDLNITAKEGGIFSNYTGDVNVSLIPTINCPNGAILAGTKQLLTYNGTEHTKQVTFLQNYAYRDLKVQIQRDGNSTCSSDNFAIRPHQYRIESAFNNTATSGLPTLLAGPSFDIFVSAVDISGNPVANYNESFSLFKSGEGAGMVVSGVFDYNSSKTFIGGVAKVEGNFTEVGTITVTIDANTTYASADSLDTGSFTIEANSTDIGRFIPENFSMDQNYTGFRSNLSTRTPGCDFVYYAQANEFDVSAEINTNVRALNSKGAVTINYSGAYAKDINMSVGLTYSMDGNVTTAKAEDLDIPAANFNNGIYKHISNFSLLLPVSTNRQTVRNTLNFISSSADSNISNTEVANVNVGLTGPALDTLATEVTLPVIYNRINPVETESGEMTFFYEVYGTNEPTLRTALNAGAALTPSVSTIYWWQNPRHQVCDDINISKIANSGLITITPNMVQTPFIVTEITPSSDRINFVYDDGGNTKVWRQVWMTGTMNLNQDGFRHLFYHPYITNQAQFIKKFKFSFRGTNNSSTEQNSIKVDEKNINMSKQKKARRFAE
jgi:hypothetical protein